MGKKRIEKIEKIQNPTQRKVCLCKRKKGLLKKTVELALLCDLKIFTFIYSDTQKRATHFASDENFDLKKIFTTPCIRDFLSTRDYGRLGGSMQDLDDDLVAQFNTKPRSVKGTQGASGGRVPKGSKAGQKKQLANGHGDQKDDAELDDEDWIDLEEPEEQEDAVESVVDGIYQVAGHSQSQISEYRTTIRVTSQIGTLLDQQRPQVQIPQSELGDAISGTCVEPTTIILKGPNIIKQNME